MRLHFGGIYIFLSFYVEKEQSALLSSCLYIYNFMYGDLLFLIDAKCL